MQLTGPMRFDRSRKRNKVSRRRHVLDPDTRMDTGAQSVPTAPFYVASSWWDMLHGPCTWWWPRARGMMKLCDQWQYLLKAWPRGAGRAGTGWKCTGRDQGFVLKGGSISTRYVFFEMGYVHVGRVQQPCVMLTRALPRPRAGLASVLV